ncbi:MAG: universal stress protein, partial [Solirubrobacteraceae bacterium]
MILIAYDGSDDAKSAIEQAGSLMSGQPAIVMTVWEPYIRMLTRYPAPGALLAGENIGEADDASSRAAEDKAEEGAALARSHGLDASSCT